MRPLVWIAAFFLAGVLFLFAYHGYPTPSTDAPSFLVSAINFSLGRGLVNPLYPQMAFADPTGLRRHIYYPPLFPLVVSLLMPSATPRAAFLAVALLRCASLLLAAHFYWTLVARSVNLMGRSLAFLIAASLCGLSTNWLPTLGRAEALGTLLILAAGLAAVRVSDDRTRVPLFGVLLGLLGATQPFGAVELFLVMGLYFAARFPTRRTLFAAWVTGSIALGVFATVLALSPHGLWETLRGMARAYPHTPWWAPPGPEWWKPWLVARRSTFYGPFLLLSLACGVHLLVLYGRRLGSPAAFVALGAPLAACLYLGSLTHKSLRNYNALILSPLFYGIVIFWFALSMGWTARGIRWARGACAVVVLATTVGFFGHLASFPAFLLHCRGLDEARAAWRSLPLPAGAPIALVGNLWVLSEDYDRMKFMPLVDALGEPIRRRSILVLSQRSAGAGGNRLSKAPRLPGFVLVRDLFSPALANPRGPKRYFLEEDYSFAVYVPAVNGGARLEPGPDAQPEGVTR